MPSPSVGCLDPTSRTTTTASLRHKNKQLGEQSIKEDNSGGGLLRKAFGLQFNRDVDDLQLWEKDEVCDFLHWLKFGIAVCAGVICGVVPVEGVAGLVLFGLLLVAITYTWCRKVGIDDDVMDATEILQEGTLAAVMAFMLTWTGIYTFLFF
eukprot:GHVS01077356.1.p2 GENE.GHVS01077356.1~~GHVS01077356.1.p2  ORF type:complete len:152 (+),score=39.90 GHVS01077356.1:194-649(+)